MERETDRQREIHVIISPIYIEGDRSGGCACLGRFGDDFQLTQKHSPVLVIDPSTKLKAKFALLVQSKLLNITLVFWALLHPPSWECSFRNTIRLEMVTTAPGLCVGQMGWVHSALGLKSAVTESRAQLPA